MKKASINGKLYPHGLESFNIVKMFILPKATDRFDVTLVKIPMAFFFFSEVEKTTFKFIWNCKRPENQNHFEGEMLGGPHIPDLKLTTKIISVVVPTSG